jgi:uncharacterized membrane-anchored protein
MSDQRTKSGSKPGVSRGKSSGRVAGKSAPQRNGMAFRVEDRFAVHPRRGQVVGEIHARPFHSQATPSHIFRFALMTTTAQAETHREALRSLLADRALPPMPDEARHHRIELAGVSFRWEQHTEFTTYDFSVPDPDIEAFALPVPESVQAYLDGLPGELLVACRLALVPKSAKRQFTGDFDPNALSHSTAEDGRAVILTDLKPDLSGFTRIAIIDHALTPTIAGTLVQRVSEVETYRTLALLGLPMAQSVSPRVADIERALADVTVSVQSAQGLDANRKLLEQLAELAAETEAISAETSYRFSATQAYGDIVLARLRTIEEEPTEGGMTLGMFLARRTNPAMATCRAMESRLETLAAKLARAASLLRARVDVELESQNRDLLENMNHRARLQLRLQRTVEGLSVAAVSYYIVGLAAYVIKGTDGLGTGFSPGVLTAAAVPIVVIGMWLAVQRIRARNEHDDRD